jgi:hypothetical protein
MEQKMWMIVLMAILVLPITVGLLFCWAHLPARSEDNPPNFGL